MVFTVPFVTAWIALNSSSAGSMVAAAYSANANLKLDASGRWKENVGSEAPPPFDFMEIGCEHEPLPREARTRGE